MTLNIRSLKQVYSLKIQKGKRIQIPLTIWNPSKLYEGLPIELETVQKGDIITSPGLFIRFIDVNSEKRS